IAKMSDIGDWFKSIPFITRYWFAGSILVPLIGKLGIISPVYLVLWPDAFINKFQIWRPISSTLYFPVGPGTGFLYLVNLYFLYQYSTRLETGTASSPAGEGGYLDLELPHLAGDMQPMSRLGPGVADITGARDSS
ncbi:Derlin-1, partial [Acipenser ruthenus]